MRMLSGADVSVEPSHLHRYLDEQALRFNERKMSGEKFAAVMGNVSGKRLTWNEVTGKGLELETPPLTEKEAKRERRGKRKS